MKNKKLLFWGKIVLAVLMTGLMVLVGIDLYNYHQRSVQVKQEAVDIWRPSLNLTLIKQAAEVIKEKSGGGA